MKSKPRESLSKIDRLVPGVTYHRNGDDLADLEASEKDPSVKLLAQDNEIVGADEKEPLVDDFDENFIDRVAQPVGEGEGTYCDVCYLEF